MSGASGDAKVIGIPDTYRAADGRVVSDSLPHVADAELAAVLDEAGRLVAGFRRLGLDFEAAQVALVIDSLAPAAGPAAAPGSERVSALRDSAARLVADLDAAALYQAAAHASMALVAIIKAGDVFNDNQPRTETDLEFELDEHGRVWMIKDGDCEIIGRIWETRCAMLNFLSAAGSPHS